MSVSKVNLEELSTLALREKFKEEWERVSDILIRIFPLSNEALLIVLRDLQLLYEELKRRNEPLDF